MKPSLALIFLFIPILAISAPKQGQLVGHWRYTDANQTCDMTFAADGTFSGKISRDGAVAWKYAGKWSLADTNLNYEYTESSLERIPVGTTDRDTLVEITKDYYVIEARDGSRRKYARVK